MQSITNQLFLQNVETRRTELNLKIGELEEKVGVSAGYFSRLAKNPTSLPSMEIILSVSKVLEISTDILLTQDLLDLSGDDLMIYTFIRKLCSDTISKKIEWKETNNILRYQDIEVSGSRKKYGKAAYTNGASFITKLRDGAQITLNQFCFKQKGNPIFPFLELRLRNDNNDKSEIICSSDGLSNSTSPLIMTILFDLLNCINRAELPPQVSPRAKTAMTNYLYPDN